MKTDKPIPKAERLKYKSTLNQPDIKIFVSHRIDLDSETVDNPLYIPVRCGAVYDERENVELLGDDTGDNISQKRMSYNELTVLYWAWKNVKADYYGLHHYRRYLSFSPNIYPADPYGNLLDSVINEESIQRYALLPEPMRQVIAGYDIILPTAQDVATYPEKFASVWEQYDQNEHLFGKDLQTAVEIIAKRHPEYAQAAEEYIRGTIAHMCNMFIMKRELFLEYAEWLFDILGEFEKSADMSHYTREALRTPGHLGERLLGIFVKYQRAKNPDLKVLELQPAVFLQTERKRSLLFSRPDRKKKPDAKTAGLSPAYPERNIAIALSFGELYAPYAATLIQSVLDFSSPEYHYDIVCIETDLSLESRRRLLAMQVEDRLSLRIVSVKELGELPDIHVHGYFSIATFMRLFLPFLLSGYSKALWLDSDVLLQRDAAELFLTDIGENLVGAALDYHAVAESNGVNPELRKLRETQLQMQDPYQYFQSGVLLMNLKKFRELFSIEDIVGLVQNCPYPYLDQDVLNKICYGRVHWLDNRWNMVADVENCLSNILDYWAPASVSEYYRKYKDHPWIIHYAGPTKPWHSPNNALADRFWLICRQTPFYEQAFVHMLSDIGNGIQRYGMEPVVKQEETAAHIPPVAAEPQMQQAETESLLKRGVRCLRERGLRYTFYKIFQYIKKR